MSNPYAVPQPSDPNRPAPPPHDGQPVPPPGPPAYGQFAPPMPQGPPAYGQFAPPMPQGPPAYGQYGAGQQGAGQHGADYYGVAKPQAKVGDALRFAWAKYKRVWGAWVGFLVIVVGLTVACYLPLGMQFAAWYGRLFEAALNSPESFTFADMPPFGFTFGAISLAFFASVVSAAAGMMSWDTVLREADGTRPGFAKFFAVRNTGNAAATAVVMLVASFLVQFVSIASIPWALFSMFAIAFAVDHNMSPFAAIGASFKLVAKNFGTTLLVLVTALGLNLGGALAFGIGIFVSAPLSLLMYAYVFRRLTRGRVA